MSKQFYAKVRSSGRITIPYELREVLKIDEGDLVKVEIIEPSYEIPSVVVEVEA